MHKNLQITNQLNELLNEVEKVLPQKEIQNIKEFIENREWGLAYETLCLQLYEYDVRISLEFYNKISSLGKLMAIDSSLWLPLFELIN